MAVSAQQTAFRSALDVVAAVEPRVSASIEAELDTQRRQLKLVASENYASPAVLLAMGNWLSDKYAEGVPGRRMYAGCEHVDQIERIAAEHARALFARRPRLRPTPLGHRRQPGRLLGDTGPPS